MYHALVRLWSRFQADADLESEIPLDRGLIIMFLLSLNPLKPDLTTSCKAMKVERGSSTSRTEILGSGSNGWIFPV
jgi:hypothetical protein